MGQAEKQPQTKLKETYSEKIIAINMTDKGEYAEYIKNCNKSMRKDNPIGK